MLQFSKSDQTGKGTTIVKPNDHNYSILQQALKKIISVRPPVEDPLLSHFDNKPFTPYQFSAVLTKTLHHLKIDRIWSEGWKPDVRGDFTNYLQDKVKKIVKKKRAINERTKLQQELDNLVGNDLQ